MRIRGFYLFMKGNMEMVSFSPQPILSDDGRRQILQLFDQVSGDVMETAKLLDATHQHLGRPQILYIASISDLNAVVRMIHIGLATHADQQPLAPEELVSQCVCMVADMIEKDIRSRAPQSPSNP